MASNRVTVNVDMSGMDEAIAKAKELKDLLEAIKELQTPRWPLFPMPVYPPNYAPGYLGPYVTRNTNSTDIWP